MLHICCTPEVSVIDHPVGLGNFDFFFLRRNWAQETANGGANDLESAAGLVFLFFLHTSTGVILQRGSCTTQFVIVATLNKIVCLVCNLPPIQAIHQHLSEVFGASCFFYVVFFFLLLRHKQQSGVFILLVSCHKARTDAV